MINRRKVRVLLPAFGAIGIVIAVWLTIGQSQAQGDRTIRGELQVFSTGLIYNGDSCSVLGRLTDLDGFNSRIVVRNELGVVIATGTTTDIGTASLSGTPVTDSDIDFDESFSCSTPFEVKDVPEAAFYTLEFGGGGRHPTVTYSRTEMEDRNWEISYFISNSSDLFPSDN